MSVNCKFFIGDNLFISNQIYLCVLGTRIMFGYPNRKLGQKLTYGPTMKNHSKLSLDPKGQLSHLLIATLSYSVSFKTAGMKKWSIKSDFIRQNIINIFWTL